jgi:nucleotide-binding universal stress UspA family protein
MKILFATDGSRHSRCAVDLLARTRFNSPNDQIRVLVVVPTARRTVQTALRSDGETLARGEAQRLRDVGCSVQTELREGHVANCIIDTAEEFGAELVVVGSRGLSGAKRFFLGSVSQKTMRYAPCSVLVARPPGEPTSDQSTRQQSPLRILVAFDGSRSARDAIDNVASLPLSDDTEITIVTALPLIPYFRTDIIQTESPEWRRRKSAAQAGLASVARVLGRATPHVSTTLREGNDEADEILKAADELGVDVIVLGHKGKSAITRFLLGSVSNRVVHHAKCSVWMVRPPSQT